MILEESTVQATIQEQLPVIYFALAWALISFYLAWKRDFFSKVFLPFYSTIDGRDVFWGFFSFIVSQMIVVPTLINGIIYFFTGETAQEMDLSQSTKSALNLFVLLGGYFALLVFFLVYLSKEKRHSIFGTSSLSWYKHYFFGASTWFLIYPFVLFWGQLIQIGVLALFRHSPSTQLAVQQYELVRENPFLLTSYTAVIFILVPIAEEFLFRGLFQSWLKKKLSSSFWGIIGASLLFASFHYTEDQGLSNIELLSSLFILSCFLGYLYEKSHSLWTSIGLHSFFNLVSLILILFGD